MHSVPSYDGFRQFTAAHFPQQKPMGRDDHAIIAGDFAFRGSGVSR